jgi:hypothetical protein
MNREKSAETEKVPATKKARSRCGHVQKLEAENTMHPDSGSLLPA